MDTKLLTLKEKDLVQAGNIIREGGLVAFPTETVYGLGANGLKEEAVKKIYEAKGRPSDNPLILHVASVEEAKSLWAEESEIANILMKEFWPGPLTIVMKSRDFVPRITRAFLDTVAVRLPDSYEARKIIENAGVAVAAPSANLSGRPSPTSYTHVIDDMEGKIDAIVCGRDCNIGIESTVVLVEDEKLTILRPGQITKEDIQKALDFHRKKDLTVEALSNEEGEQINRAPLSPGMKYRHYAPRAKMIIFRGESHKVDLEVSLREDTLKREGYKVGLIDFSEESLKDAARLLFARLREMDEQEVDIILAKAVSESGIGFAIMNRMIKSAGYEIIEV